MNRLAKILRDFFRGAGELSPSCREASRLLSAALDRPLPWRQRVGLRIHLLLCKWCSRYGQQLRFLRSVAHHYEQHEESLPKQALKPEARERIRQRLQEEKE